MKLLSLFTNRALLEETETGVVLFLGVTRSRLPFTLVASNDTMVRFCIMGEALAFQIPITLLLATHNRTLWKG